MKKTIKINQTIWVSINEGETKSLLIFLKSKGVKWLNGNEVEPETDRKGYHFCLENGRLGYVSTMCWKLDKKGKDIVDFKGLKTLYGEE